MMGSVGLLPLCRRSKVWAAETAETMRRAAGTNVASILGGGGQESGRTEGGEHQHRQDGGDGPFVRSGSFAQPRQSRTGPPPYELGNLI